MGQYHAIYNITKKEMINPHSFDDGAKLLEWVGGPTLMGLALLLANSNGRGGGDLTARYSDKDKNEKELAIDLVAGRWAGDKIVVQGDYAEKGDKAFISENKLEEYENISSLVVRALSVDRYINEKFFQKGSPLLDKYIKGNIFPLEAKA